MLSEPEDPHRSPTPAVREVVSDDRITRVFRHAVGTGTKSPVDQLTDFSTGAGATGLSDRV